MIGNVDQVIGIFVLVLFQGGVDDPLVTGLINTQDMGIIDMYLSL